MGKESHRKRSRSRDRDRKKSRSRSPRRGDRKRSRSRDRDRKHRDRSRDRSPRRRSRSRDRKHERSAGSSKYESEKKEKREERRDRDVDTDRQKEAERSAVEEEAKKQQAKEEENKELERIMEERRKKVEEWRERQRKLKMATATVEAAPEEKMEVSEEANQSTGKKWSLEDEDDDDEFPPLDSSDATEEKNGTEVNGNGETKMETNDDEEDPLDAFMSNVAKDIQKTRGVKTEPGVRVVTINTAPVEEKNKGEILENEGRAEVVVDDFDLESAAQSLCHKARLLNAADHTKIYYRPFRKDFYVETQEIARMKKSEVKMLRDELDNIEIKGKHPPKPIKTWAQCGVELKILHQLKKLNYTKPTPIQAQSIPAIMSGRDVIGVAKTGSGKTLAFLLPMFRHIMDQDELEDMDGPIALIMAPTRELCMQTWKEANKFAKVLNLRVVCAYGGVGISEQIADLKRGAEIIVCTPGRMIDLLVSNGGRVTNLRRVTYLVLDEADRMFDMGFEPQVMKIVDNIRPDRQTVLFSATFPRQMEALARKVLENPIEILVGGKSVVCSDITQNVVICEEHQKALKLLELLGIYYEMGNVIVFVDRQEKADEICGVLIGSGYPACAPLHGGIDQSDRDSNIVDFKNGTVKILVATSVAARGLDVKNLLLVVNYDCPNHYEDYVHRVGRTGRAGNKGYAYTFILPDHQERMAGEICRAFESAGAKPPPELKAMFERFKEEMAQQGKEVHLGGKGFSGSGYKYDDEEAEADSSKKKMTRLLTNIEHGQADDDELEEQLNNMLKTTRRIVAGGGGSGGGGGGGGKAKMTEKVQDKIAAAKARAEQLAVLQKAPAAPEKDAVTKAAEAVMRGSAITPLEMTAEAKARELANKLNEKLNYVGGEAPKLNMGDDWEYYEEEMDINDFPQQVRYKICSRDSVGHIAEYADVGLSVRGTHYPSGREPKNGDRRLHLLIEARSEMNLRRAKEEIVRIMKDSLRQLSQGPRGGMQARYRV